MKKIHYYIYILIVATIGMASCNDWLDVKPYGETKEKHMYESVDGYKDALIGCYSTLSSNNLFGQRLTISNIESLANLWHVTSTTSRPTDYYFTNHEYTQEDAEASIKSIYLALYNVITQANVILMHIQEDATDKIFDDPTLKDVIEGEAYAIKAFCHLEVLRLFGQMPTGGGKQVSLPYSDITSIETLPTSYNYAEYIKFLEADFNKAEELLKDQDPICTNSFESFGSLNMLIGSIDDFLQRRQLRFNYWAIKGIKARMYLYLGEKEKAHTLAMEIINAKKPTDEEKPLISLNGVSDFREKWNTRPSEALLSFYKKGLKDNNTPQLFGGTPTSQLTDQNLYITLDMYGDLFAGQAIQDIRQSQLWNVRASTSAGELHATSLKYWYDEKLDNISSAAIPIKLDVIPILRLSEIYLIAMETSRDLNEVNRLFTIYKASHGVSAENHFNTLDEVPSEIIDEYRREFFGEGHMFYTYKRTNSITMLWSQEKMDENTYVLPAPIVN